MLNTKLILIEGLPGAGKTTTALHLGKALQGRGIPCRWHLEEDDPHPIPCADVKIKYLAETMLPRWQTFTDAALQDPTLSIIESRLWHNTGMFMYMSDYPVKDVVTYSQHVWRVLAPLSPILVYLYQDDVDAALRRNYALRGEAWVDAAMQQTTTYAWFQFRGLDDFAGWVRFFEEWQGVAECLYAGWPYLKTKIQDPHDDWHAAFERMAAFLHM